MHREDGFAISFAGRRNLDDFVETSRAEHCGIESVEPIGRPEYQHPFELLDSVELAEKLAEHAIGDRVGREAAAASRHQRIDLVEKDDRRSGLARLAENVAQSALRLAHPF